MDAFVGYGVIALLMALGVLSIGWPEKVTRWQSMGRTFGLSERYWRDYVRSIRLVGFAIVVGLPAYLLLVVQS